MNDGPQIQIDMACIGTWCVSGARHLIKKIGVKIFNHRKINFGMFE